MCFNKASSNATSKVYDGRAGADNGSTAFTGGTGGIRIDGGNLTLGSDDTAQMAIESSTNALTATIDFLGPTLSEFFNVTDKRFERADANAAASRQMTQDLLLQESESADDRLLSVIKWGAGAAVVVVAIQSGVFKDLKGAFK